MRAVSVERLDGPDGLALVDLPEPEAGDGRVLIDVHAAGVSFPDLLLSQGLYQARPPLPFVAGVEGAGTVVDAPAATGFEPGQRVIFSGLGSWADRVRVPVDEVFALPDALTMAQGTALLMNYQTAHFALVRRGRLVRGERLLVHGAAGGVGSAAIQVGRALGAQVFAVVSTQRKADVATALGADVTVLADEGWRERVIQASGGGVDVVFDPVAGDRFDDTVRALAPEGRLVIIGFAGGSIPKLAMNRVLFRNIDIVGAAWGAFLQVRPDVKRTTHEALLQLVEEGAVRPLVGAELPLERAADALRLLSSREATGKVVLTLREEAAP